MPIELVTLVQAKDHLRVKHSHEDGDIQLKLNAATRMAIAYLDRDVYATQAELDAAIAEGKARTLPLLAVVALGREAMKRGWAYQVGILAQ